MSKGLKIFCVFLMAGFFALNFTKEAQAWPPETHTHTHTRSCGEDCTETYTETHTHHDSNVNGHNHKHKITNLSVSLDEYIAKDLATYTLSFKINNTDIDSGEKILIKFPNPASSEYDLTNYQISSATHNSLEDNHVLQANGTFEFTAESRINGGETVTVVINNILNGKAGSHVINVDAIENSESYEFTSDSYTVNIIEGGAADCDPSPTGPYAPGRPPCNNDPSFSDDCPAPYQRNPDGSCPAQQRVSTNCYYQRVQTARETIDRGNVALGNYQAGVQTEYILSFRVNITNDRGYLGGSGPNGEPCGFIDFYFEDVDLSGYKPTVEYATIRRAANGTIENLKGTFSIDTTSQGSSIKYFFSPNQAQVYGGDSFEFKFTAIPNKQEGNYQISVGTTLNSPGDYESIGTYRLREPGNWLSNIWNTLTDIPSLIINPILGIIGSIINSILGVFMNLAVSLLEITIRETSFE